MLPVATAAVAVAAAVLAAALPLEHGEAGAAGAACGMLAPADPACAGGPPAAAARPPPEGAAPRASSRYADLPNPSNTTISASSPPVAGEPLTVVLSTTLPPTAMVLHGNGTIGKIEFPDAYEDEADTSVHVLFGGDVAVLSSDPALGAPSYGEAGGNSYTEIGGTLAATPGLEYRLEFSVVPSEEGVTVIDAAGFMRGAARLVLDVAPAAGRGAAGQIQSAAAPERAGPRGEVPPGAPGPEGAMMAAVEAIRAGGPGKEGAIMAAVEALRAGSPAPEIAGGGTGLGAAAGRGAPAQPPSPAAPDPPGPGALPRERPPGGPGPEGAVMAAVEASRASAPVPAPAAPGILARSGEGHAAAAAAHAWHGRPAPPEPEPAAGGPGSRGHGGRSGAAAADAGDLVLYGMVWSDLPYSDAAGPAHGLRVCATDWNVEDGGETLMAYEDGAPACTFTNEHGLYALGPLDGADPDGDGTGPDPTILVLSYGDGVRVWNSLDFLYSEGAPYYLEDRGAGHVWLDMRVETGAMNGAARIVDAMSDARAFIRGEVGAEIPPVDVHWQYGESVAEAWGLDGDAFYISGLSWIFLDGRESRASHDMSESRYVILHEYAHHAHNHLGGASEGCRHYLTQKLSPGCAFGEGFADFFPHAVDGSPFLRELRHTFIDMESELIVNDNGVIPLFDYDDSLDRQTEIQVAGALWDVYDGPADEVHDRKRAWDEEELVWEGGILDDLHMGADEIIRIIQDGPQSAEQFYARWERQEGIGSMANIMDLHRMPFSPGDLPAVAPVPGATVSHTGEAEVPVSAYSPGGAATALSVRQGFEREHDWLHDGAAVDDDGDGTGTLILNPARADVGENIVAVRANSSGKIELARVDVTVTEPPKWAPVQLRATFDRGFADWTREPGSGPYYFDEWEIITPDSYDPFLVLFEAEEERSVFLDRGIDMTAYSSASLGLLLYLPSMYEGSYLRAYAWDDEYDWHLIKEWSAAGEEPEFRAETIPLPAGLMGVENLRIEFAAKDFFYPFVIIDDVTLTGTPAGPAIEAPGHVRAEAASPGGASADLGAPATYPAAGLAVTREPQWRSFPPGTTEVTWTATDTATGKSDSDTQLVAVLDTTPPSVAPPAGYTVRAAGADVLLSSSDYCAASAEDAVSGVLLLSDAPQYFPVGDTTAVSWLAMDYSGNSGTAEQGVTVVRSDDPHVPVSAVRAWADHGATREPGSAVEVHVEFSHPVALTAAMSGEAPGSLLPSLEMEGGGSAAYASGNGTDRLTFSYAVQPGEAAPDYAGPHALGEPCTVRSAADNRGAYLELPDPGPPGLPGPPDPGPPDPGPPGLPGIPRVVDVSVADAGVYGEGQTVGILVGFSEPVLVEGSPELLLEAGAPGAAATYAGGSGTPSLVFGYVVQPGDSAADLDYSGTGALALNGGSVSSLNGTAADLALPDPGAEPGLLAGPGGIVVGDKPQVPVGVFSGGPGDPSAEAARLGASAFNGLSVERGYPFFVRVSEYATPAGAGAAAAALRDAHDGGDGPSLYVGPASDSALHGMAGYAAASGITLVSHSSAARSLAVEGDGIYRLEPGAAHLARALAHAVARGGFDAVVPVVQADLHGSGVAGSPGSAHVLAPDAGPAAGSPGIPAFAHGLLGPLASGLEPLGIPVGQPVEFSGTPGSAAAGSIEAAVLAAGGGGTARNVAVVYVGSDSALAAIAGSTGAGSPVRERSAWFAAGGAGAGAGGGVAASPLVLSDAAALKLARDTRLTAVQFAVERNGMTDGIDGAVAAAAATASTPAYAAYEAARILGGALALAGGDPSGAGGHVARAADLDGGPLGRVILDGSGDLRLPITYGAWSVSDTTAAWERAPALLRGVDTCDMALEKQSLALPALVPGRTSGSARQTVTNTGTVPMPEVSIAAGDWALHGADGSGSGATLPFSLTEISIDSAAFDPLAAGTSIPAGTPAGGSVSVDFRLNLAEVPALDAAYIAQTVTYGMDC